MFGFESHSLLSSFVGAPPNPVLLLVHSQIPKCNSPFDCLKLATNSCPTSPLALCNHVEPIGMVEPTVNGSRECELGSCSQRPGLSGQRKLFCFEQRSMINTCVGHRVLCGPTYSKSNLLNFAGPGKMTSKGSTKLQLASPSVFVGVAENSPYKKM